jgi:hypothetical protein
MNTVLGCNVLDPLQRLAVGPWRDSFTKWFVALGSFPFWAATRKLVHSL